MVGLGTTGQEYFWKIDLSDWLKLVNTLNQFIKSENYCVENILKKTVTLKILNILSKKLNDFTVGTACTMQHVRIGAVPDRVER